MKKIKAKKPPLESIRNRNVETRRMKASDLLPNPKNWRTHPSSQSDALRAVLSEVGFVGTMIGVDTPDGVLLLDGHLRTETAGDAEVDVTIVDLSPAEQAKVLATYDPLTDLAEADGKQLDALLRDFETGEEALAEMLNELAEEAKIIDVDVQPADDEFPEINETTQHSFQVHYTADDLPALLDFLGVNELPTNKTGAKVIERIKEIAAAGTDH